MESIARSIGSALQLSKRGGGVEEDTEYANTPDPEVHTSTTQMINQGDDLNRSKKQYPMTANRAANPMAESRALLKQYSSMVKDIKK